jgi:DNA-binding NtrC family response regulator
MSEARGRLLVIDDEQDVREMLEFVLSEGGFEVETVDGGLAAVAIVRARRFDVVITDMKMPVMDGLQTLTALKEIDPTIEVIVVTGYASEQTAAECVRRGAYGYLRKPFEVEDLRALVDRALSHRLATASQAIKH